MFPTFISIIDIQSWWEVPSIAHFCSLFRTAFNLLDFDIEDLEEALLTDGTEESSWLQELIVKLLSGCLPENEISTFNYQMFLRRLFRQKCQEHDRYNPFNTDIDFQLLPLRTKVDILHALCDFRLDANDVLDQLKNLEADSLRVEPLGYDANDSAYWYFYGTRLYREDFKTKNNKKKSVWQVICFTEDDWLQLTKKLKKSGNKAEKQLYQTLKDNFLPEIPRLFKEKENLARKRLLENQPRRTSSRLRKLECDSEKEEKKEKPQKDAQEKFLKEKEKQEKEDKQRLKRLENKRKEAYERRSKLKEQSEEDTLSEGSAERDEMAGHKNKKSKGRQRKNSNSSSVSSKDTKSSKKGKKHEKEVKDISKVSNTITVGRQTNNSLSAATGQILIQPPANTNKKKLKTSQVFRQTDEDLQTGMHKILDYVKNHEDAWPFADPVEEEYAPNYYSVIRKPMDLQRMEERLDTGYYKTFTKFRDDFQLIVDNCRLYNGVENEYTEMVDNLLKVFERATEKYLDQISSSDDEIAIEYNNDSDKSYRKHKSENVPTSKRKPMLAAQTDRKRERSISEDSITSNNSFDIYEKRETTKEKKADKTVKKPPVNNKLKKDKEKPYKKQRKNDLKKEKSDNKKEKFETKDKFDVKKDKKDKLESKKDKLDNKKEKLLNKKEKTDNKEKSDQKKDKSESKKLQKDGKKKTKKSNKKERKRSPVKSRNPSRSRSRSLSRSNMSSPPPSWPPSSPDCRFDFNPKKTSKKRSAEEMSENDDIAKGKSKKHTKFDNFNVNNDFDTNRDRLSDYTGIPLSPKPKDKHNKLRETIEKLKAKSEIKLNFELDHPKENKDKNKKPEKEEKLKSKSKEKTNTANIKQPIKNDHSTDLDVDGNNTMDSVLSDSKKNKKSANHKVITNPVLPPKPTSNLDALSIATEQTLKDINKWLDDTPKFSEFSSASNSPSYSGLDEFDCLTNKAASGDQSCTVGKKSDKLSATKKEAGAKEAKKRPFRDPAKFFKRREVQRTIDRLQPGKSKGNLITNVQNTNKADEIFPLGSLSKMKDTKNSLIVKTDTNAPKLSLGSVLDSFGKHNFVDDQKKEEPKILVELSKQENQNKDSNIEIKDNVDNKDNASTDRAADKKESKDSGNVEDSGGGATPNLSAWFKAFGAPKVQIPPKKNDIRPDGKENEKYVDEISNKANNSTKVSIPIVSPNTDGTAMSQPAPRQRKISTGSSMSERSSFSQDMDSPRVGMDERGAYPAPYPSPLHKSPSGASPIMASPRPDISPKAAAYPTINGQIRCGFYQDTVSNKSSPDKSCSPRENLQSPYPHYSEHVYTPNTTDNSYYSYANSPYYTHPPNYSNTNPTPPYNMEGHSSFYDTTKSLTDQYQAKNLQTYTANSPASNQSSPAHPQLSPHSPVIHPQHSPVGGVLSPHSPGMYPQQNVLPKVGTAHSPNVRPQLSPNVSQVQQQATSPSMQLQHSPAGPKTPQAQLTQQSPGIQQPRSPQEIEQGRTQQQQQLPPPQQQQTQNTATPPSTVFPVKKRAYNEGDVPQISSQRFEIDSRLPQRGDVLSEKTKEKDLYNVHHTVVENKHAEPTRESFNTNNIGMPQQQTATHIQMNNTPPSMPLDPSNMNYSSANINPYNSYTTESSYPLNIPNTRNIASSQQAKIDMSKYTNMGYTGPDVNYSRHLQDFIRPEMAVSTARTTVPNTSSMAQVVSSTQANDTRMRYNNPNTSLQQMGYKTADARISTAPQQAHSSNFTTAATGSNNRTATTEKSQEVTPTGFKPDTVSVPRPPPTYNTSDVEQSLGLGRNLSHIVDRFGNDERIMAAATAGLQTSSASYYPEKNLSTSHMFNKPVSTVFSQAANVMQSYNQGTPNSLYGRQIVDMQSNTGDMKPGMQQTQMVQQEKKSKKRKSSKAALNSAADAQQQQQQQTGASAASHQGFQSYAGLKATSSSSSTTSIEPSAISLKTSSVVPGSAFNFGPTPSALGIPPPGLYGDKDTYQNFLDEFRSTPNYYMTTHHRTTPDAPTVGGDKQTRAAHQNTPTNPQTTPGYPFLGGPPQARPTYPIGGPFIPNQAAQLMDTGSPLYQHYLPPTVLNQGLLGPPGAYPPPGYLSIRQPYDSMTRPSWL